MANESSKTVLITGAAGGIGRATVALFAEKGWRVIGVDRSRFGEGFPADGLFIQPEPQAVSVVEVGAGSGRLRFSLAGPQPIRDLARFRFDLPVAESATLELFDVMGRRAADRIGAFWPAGPHEVTVSARTLSPGVYAARLTSGRERESVLFIRVR